MHAGAAARARGDYVLFTDGDVDVSRDHVDARCGSSFRTKGWIIWRSCRCITSPSTAVRWSVGAFAIFFLLFTRAWQRGRSSSRASIGIGAFNLVRTSVYRAAGGHEPIRLRPDDDLRLGRLLKRAAQRRECGAAPAWCRWTGIRPSVRSSTGWRRTASPRWTTGRAPPSRALPANFSMPLLSCCPLWVTGSLRMSWPGRRWPSCSRRGPRRPGSIGQPGWSALLQPLVLPSWPGSRLGPILLTLRPRRHRLARHVLSAHELRRNQPPQAGR